MTKIEWIPEVGLVSSSLDTTVKTFDIAREKIINTCTHHTKGVHSFVWCRAYSLIASCGLQRDILVWQVSRTERGTRSDCN
jgi:WD40 repeat protein